MLTSSHRAVTVQSPALLQVAGVAALMPLKPGGGVGFINALFDCALFLQTPDALNFKGYKMSQIARE
jgi:hypothetical protein